MIPTTNVTMHATIPIIISIVIPIVIKSIYSQLYKGFATFLKVDKGFATLFQKVDSA